MSLFTHHTVPTWFRSGGPFLVGLLGTSLGLLVVWVFASPQALLLGMASLLGSGAIVGLIRQDQTALLAVVLGSLLAGGVVCVLIFWSAVTGSLSSNFYPYVVFFELVALFGVAILVGVGFALGAAVGSLVRRRP